MGTGGPHVSLHPSGPSRQRWEMAGMGQEDQFPPPGLSACYVIREKTFAAMHGDGRDAPKAVIRTTASPDVEVDAMLEAK